MNSRTQLLLDEVLAEEASPAQSEPGLAVILAAVRRRRRNRQVGRAAVLAAVFALAVSPLVAPWWRRPVRPLEGGPEASLSVVFSVPLDRASLVETESGLFATVETKADSVALLATASAAEPVPEIDDQQLLLLAADRTPALVRRGPNDTVLLLLDEHRDAAAP